MYCGQYYGSDDWTVMLCIQLVLTLDDDINDKDDLDSGDDDAGVYVKSMPG